MALASLKSRMMGAVPLGNGKGKVIVAGMPKSGTTAIASLLASAAGVQVCSDPFYQLDKKGVDFRRALFSSELSLERLWREHRDVFRGTVVKDPNFPLFLGELKHLLPEAGFVFIVREPLDNIRSILNRLEVPGDPEKGVCHLENARGAWNLLLKGISPDMPGKNYLEKIAWRWRVSAEHYLNNREGVRLIRYEDFREEKVGQIKILAGDLGFQRLKDISSLVDVQFQPKGKQPSSFEEFFGKENLEQIETIVGPLRETFGYEK
jgi:hypothetical protein